MNEWLPLWEYQITIAWRWRDGVSTFSFFSCFMILCFLWLFKNWLGCKYILVWKAKCSQRTGRGKTHLNASTWIIHIMTVYTDKRCRCIKTTYTPRANSGLESDCNVPSFLAPNSSRPASRGAHRGAGSSGSRGGFLLPMRKKLLKSWGRPSRALMWVIWKLQRCWPLAKRQWPRTGEAERESLQRQLSPGAWKTMGQELCAKTLRPGCSCHRCWEGGDARSCQRRAPERTEAAIQVLVCQQQQHLSLLTNPEEQRPTPFPVAGRGWWFCGRSQPIKRNFY